MQLQFLSIASLVTAALAVNTTVVTITSCSGGCNASTYEGNAQANRPLGYVAGGAALAAGALLAF
ncbi:hypothetical protein CANTEDRAFT_112625 [Yamadazyma tenuis ATCC 10573]|uniref:Uncharacterized protein n=1 Tax=Candida tenuis (strain ATCC 10573 / BCRC 21748 / CBS 615 / JCM 9827 / NBRC 10315 / NRRL Y-1498 / VKM Y-70) TaxID=590646 RepID=G3AY38_CANTC|nr:uncharacterized protein CANTEDRAFT_112625 [Yamadazyma tenuis ATCC 10573]XP_006684741.1 uncharacterized protein CANTEDRAFT_112625 [Yamadazyma tenuis ATCC 10573]EGV66166.1 hypothetical protein CANTEDRAFT_112625 [Yamadazyma tenuis ATCC 10573]EGV66167.1 hypothetical protein CANTEDRAFT_112625 [Yamadazyma tenuis ATCC 10573]